MTPFHITIHGQSHFDFITDPAIGPYARIKRKHVPQKELMENNKKD